MSPPRRILFVAMHHSIHTARWIDMIADFGFDLHMFAIDGAEPNNKLRAVTLHKPVPASTIIPSSVTPIVAPAPQQRRQRDRIDVTPRRLLRWTWMFLTSPRKALSRLVEWVWPLPVTDVVAAPIQNVRILPVPVELNPAATAARVRFGRTEESAETTDVLHGPAVLAGVIRELRPDLIHSMEFQHAGYLALAARDLMLEEDPDFPFPCWLATNWGSDIFHFGKEPGHARQIRRLCETIDLYSCECHRDVEIGRSFGYGGPSLPVLPNSGGMNMAHVRSLRSTEPPSRRKLIMVKGYDHFAGRAMVSLALLERFAQKLKDYKVVLFSVGARPRMRAIELAAQGVFDIEVLDRATHDEILSHFGRARIYLGISVSDAISTSVLEAMAMGAFPIQTDTSCCEEWFISGESGFAVPPDDFELICDRFVTALSDDALVDRAAQINLQIIRCRLDAEVLRPKMRDFYAQALAYAER
jgi:hypothetical protein